jgi:hypothetical protein
MRKDRIALRALLVTILIASTVGKITARQNEKLAQTGMKFLTVESSGRQTALGDAFTAGDGYSISMLYNPAGMARLGSNTDISFGRTQWLADITHEYASVAFNLGEYGVLGFSGQYVDYGDIQSTILVDKSISSQGFIDVGTFKPYGWAIGVGYARSLTDKFSVGGNVKWVKEDLGNSYTQVGGFNGSGSSVTPNDSLSTIVRANQTVMAFDFGIMYRTGIKSLTFGMSVRNFSREVTFVQQSFQLPLTFKIGLSMNMLDLMDMDPSSQSLLLLVDAEHPRDYPEQLRVGAEYLFASTVALRIGYVSPADLYTFSYGIGVQQAWFGTQLEVDYSYTPYKVFDAVNRISLRFAI